MKTQMAQIRIKLRNHRQSQSLQARVCAVIAAVTLCSAVPAVNAAPPDARAQAKRIHDRLAGVPPTDAVLTQMEGLINSNGGPTAPGSGVEAAKIAMQNSNFYSVTLKNFAMPWTNRDQTVFAPLNDYVATVIGMVRDDEPFNTVLSGDIIYTGNGITPAYSTTGNDHYQAMEDQNANLMQVLTKQTQSSVTGLPAGATAGVLTTRAGAQAFFIAGTNRAMFRFTMINYMCRDMEQVQETSRAPDRIRQDVARSPGGDSRIFLNSCIGCHGGMDPMAQAFAYYNYDETAGKLVYTPGQVQPKYLINSDNFKTGFVTPDDQWENRWRAGPNMALGWSGALPGKGSGAKSLGDEFGNSEVFAQCQVEKVFRAVCFRSPATADVSAVDQIVSHFKSGYKLKQVFAETADYCKGG